MFSMHIICLKHIEYEVYLYFLCIDIFNDVKNKKKMKKMLKIFGIRVLMFAGFIH